MEALWERLGALSAEDRRRTMDRLTATYPDTRGQQAPSGSNSNSTSTRGERLTYVDASARKIKKFSGAKKPGSGELDYKHWKRAAERIRDDPELTQAQKRRYVLSSIVGEAEDVITLHRENPIDELLHILDNVYGSMQSGDDRLADFFQIFQEGETTSEYLRALYLELTEIVQLDALHRREIPSALLKQFVRGTQDEAMLAKLRLEEKTVDPPDFPELFQLVRQEESRRAERKQRQRKVGRSRQAVATEPSAPADATPSPSPATNSQQQQQQPSELDEVKGELAELKLAFANLARTTRKGFCFRCGLDGHHAPECRNDPNPSLVQERRSAQKSKN